MSFRHFLAYYSILIGVSTSKQTLFENQWIDMLTTFIYLFVLQIIIDTLILFLLKKNVINGIHQILNHLHSIQKGNLQTVVDVNDNIEFKELSTGINNMVNGLVHSTDRISRIIEMSDIPLSAFEYQKEPHQLFFVTVHFKDLLEIHDDEVEILQNNPHLFLKKLKDIRSHAISIEKDIYQINPQKYIKIILFENENGFYGTINDVTKTMREKNRIQYENEHDALTGLLRFSYFKDTANKMIQTQDDTSICAAVMLDLDAFKNINDSYGHDFGDCYLKHFSQILNDMPKEHTLISRRSGDEFCLLMYHYQSKEEIINELNHLWQMMNQNPIFINDNQSLIIKISAGFSCCENHNTSIEQLLNEADQALYEAKKKFKNHFIEYSK